MNFHPLFFTIFANRYLYNGKESQDDLGLSYLDYGARMYDSRIGRWHSIDPKAEKYYSLTTYDFVGGNPIICIDPNGENWYFDRNGNYLGEDLEGVEVRVMSYEDWKQNMSNYENLIKNSSLLSSNDLLNSAMVKIFQYFYKGKFGVRATDDSPYPNYFAYADVNFNVNKFNGKTMRGAKFSSGEIVLNMGLIKGHDFFDNGYNIMNLMFHENYHIEDAQSNPDRFMLDYNINSQGEEVRAIEAQMNHKSWGKGKTSEDWMNHFEQCLRDDRLRYNTHVKKHLYPKKLYPWLY